MKYILLILMSIITFTKAVSQTFDPGSAYRMPNQRILDLSVEGNIITGIPSDQELYILKEKPILKENLMKRDFHIHIDPSPHIFMNKFNLNPLFGSEYENYPHLLRNYQQSYEYDYTIFENGGIKLPYYGGRPVGIYHQDFDIRNLSGPDRREYEELQKRIDQLTPRELERFRDLERKGSVVVMTERPQKFDSYNTAITKLPMDLPPPQKVSEWQDHSCLVSNSWRL